MPGWHRCFLVSAGGIPPFGFEHEAPRSGGTHLVHKAHCTSLVRHRYGREARLGNGVMLQVAGQILISKQSGQLLCCQAHDARTCCRLKCLVQLTCNSGMAEVGQGNGGSAPCSSLVMALLHVGCRMPWISPSCSGNLICFAITDRR